jgi:hypothetical protein
MAVTVSSSRDFDVQQLNDVIPGEFARKTAFMGSILASKGAVVVNGSMPAGNREVGNTITIPRFGVIGEFEDLNENTAATPVSLATKSDTATVGHSALAFEVSAWAQASGDPQLDPYKEAARQIVEAAQRKMDALIVTAAAATPLVAAYYSATTPSYLDWDKVVDARAKWGDRQNDIVALCVHSRTEAGLRKMRDGEGRPLLLDSMKQGDLTTFCGIPLVVSDMTPLTLSTMGAVTSSGTTPPVATLAGTPTGPWDLRVEVLTSHASDTTIRFSTDGGNTFSAAIAAADGGVAVALIDTTKDSTVGNNGTTGITIAFAAGTFNADNRYSATALLKSTSLIVQKGALAFWYNQALMQLQTDKDILKDNDVAAMHMYRVAHLYQRRVGGVLPGVVALTHNVQNYIG